jgi:hypothetical protein
MDNEDSSELAGPSLSTPWSPFLGLMGWSVLPAIGLLSGGDATICAGTIPCAKTVGDRRGLERAWCTRMSREKRARPPACEGGKVQQLRLPPFRGPQRCFVRWSEARAPHRRANAVSGPAGGTARLGGLSPTVFWRQPKSIRRYCASSRRFATARSSLGRLRVRVKLYSCPWLDGNMGRTGRGNRGPVHGPFETKFVGAPLPTAAQRMGRGGPFPSFLGARLRQGMGLFFSGDGMVCPRSTWTG